MSDTQHYRFQSEQAKRLARQVADTTIREKLLEMADEYGRNADLIEAGSGRRKQVERKRARIEARRTVRLEPERRGIRLRAVDGCVPARADAVAR